MKEFKSCAVWADWDAIQVNITTDLHSTLAAAEGVCSGLERDGYGGLGQYFPVRTYVMKWNKEHTVWEVVK